MTFQYRRGILGLAAMMAGLGVDLPPPPSPRKPEPTPEEIAELEARCAASGIDVLTHDDLKAGIERFREIAYGVEPSRPRVEDVTTDAQRARGEVVHRVSGLGVKGRGPGIQLRDERERCGETLRILAAYTGLTQVEIGEFERGKAIPTPEQWAALQVVLPGLGPMEPAPTEAERSLVLTVGELRERGVALPEHYRPEMRMQVGWGSDVLFVEAPRIERAENTLSPKAKAQRDAWLEAALHPSGRCTCGGGGTGNCAWCVMDQRREKREARHERRTERDRDGCRRELVLASVIESERKAKHHKARARVKARRGW